MPSKASYQRIDRISEEVRREVDRIIRDELNDPRVTGTFSITRAEVTRDLRYAKIYVSVLEDERRADLGREMIIRTAPELIFVEDRNIAYGAHIAQVLREVHAGEAPEETEGETDAESGT